MIRQVTHILAMFERHGEGRCVIRLSLYPACSLWAPSEVVSIVTDVGARPGPKRPTLHRFNHREQQWTHTWKKYTM